jgi:hypothetical protein
LQYKRLQSVWDEIKRSEAKVLFRGVVPTNTEGLFFPVTLLDNPSDDASFVTQEVFGPIHSIFKYKNLDEAVCRLPHFLWTGAPSVTVTAQLNFCPSWKGQKATPPTHFEESLKTAG